MQNFMKIITRKHVYTMMVPLLLCPSWTAFAASAVPDAGNVLRNTQNFEKNLPSHQNPIVEVGETVRPPMTANTGFKVKVETIHITGQDIFAQSQLDEILKDQMHKELTFSELNTAATTVTKFFKEHGYLLAQAYLPAQEIENGKVEIAVLVGRYGDVVLKNTSQVSNQAIKKQLTGLTSGSYINNRDLERAVLLAGDLAGVSAKITLSPGKYPGTADVVMETKEKEGSKRGSISINNWGTRFTGSTQGIVDYTIDNIGHSGDSFTTSITNAGSGLDAGSARYSMPIKEGVNLNLSYSKVHYSLGDEYASLNAHGTAYTKHIDMTWNVQRSRNADVSFQVGYDHKRLQDLYDTTSTVTDKWLHAVNLGITGDTFDQLWGGGANSYSLMWYKGALGANSNTTMPPVGNWQKTTYNMLRQQVLTNRLSLLLSFSGQLASTNLDSSEKFSLGGANGVRAYPTNEGSGDEAWILNSELHWNIPVKSDKGVLQLIWFYDTGVSNIEKNPASSDGNRKALAGKGLGISWTVPGDYGVKVNYAWKAGSTAATSDRDKNGRLWLQAFKYF